MGVGNGTPFLGYNSIIGVAEETTYGTFVTSTSNLEFLSEGFKIEREEKKIETINSSRFIKKRLQGNESVNGSIETYLNPASDSLCVFLKQAMGGTVSSATITIANQYLHTFATGNMESNDSSVSAADIKGLSIAVRRGDTHVFNHYGCRVNGFTIKGEVGNPITVNFDFIAKGMSVSATLPSFALPVINPFNFTDVTFASGASITTVATEYITGFELSLANNLVADARNLGSRQIYVSPPQRQEVTLKISQNFDTTTSYDRFIQNTSTALQITLDTGITITAGVGGTTYAMIISIPEAYCNSNNPVVSDTGIIKQEANFTVIYSSASSYYFKIEIRNGTAGY